MFSPPIASYSEDKTRECEKWHRRSLPLGEFQLILNFKVNFIGKSVCIALLRSMIQHNFDI